MCCQVKLVELVPSNTQRRFIKIEQQVEMKAQHKLTYASKQLREETDLSLEHGKREIFMTGLRYLLPKIYGALNYHAYYSFSYSALGLILSDHYKKWNFKPFNYFEFGTGEGNSLRFFLRSLKKIIKSHDVDRSQFNIFLFDSFEGLPENDIPADKNPAWQKGQFRGTLEKIKVIVSKEFPDIVQNTKFVQGYYDKTLTEELRNSLANYQPSIVNIDVDYYSSTKTVLKWLCDLAQDGTIFYFDDIYAYLGNLSKGEYRAIDEFNKEHLKDGHQFYPFVMNFNIPTFIGKIYTLNKVEK